ncbi:hypothetical protein ACIBO2_35745 [Nonomuraea sp. NPDC050022]|uniref:hypothetical protein n=1 Tax=Nonomuraea sp. NPDC050022 TaxID=3364358 RepID=UPI00378E2630
MVDTAADSQGIEVDALIALAIRIISAIYAGGAAHEPLDVCALPISVPANEIGCQGSEI